MAYVYEPNQFISDFHNGDEMAFRYVYDIYKNGLTYYALHRVSDRDTVYLIVSDAFEKLVKNRCIFESLSHIKRWLYIIVRNGTVSHYRERGKTVLFDSSYEEESLTNTPEDFNIDIEMLKSLVLLKMQEDIEALPRQRKMVLKLYFFEEKTTPEIMKITGLCQQTVLNHKARAIDALRYKFLQQGITCVS